MLDALSFGAPLHPSQKNKKLKDGSLEVAFEVAGTKEIKTWILGFGSLAKVLEPRPLVKEIKDDLRKALRSYGKPRDRL
ncbi:MAG TPA: WYL domain-containing protein [Candidatus Binatia bacterium]